MLDVIHFILYVTVNNRKDKTVSTKSILFYSPFLK